MGKVLNILDDNYGDKRDLIKDLGGIAVWIDTDKDWIEVKELFHLEIGMEEYKEEFKMDNGKITELLFQISSDYSLVIFTWETSLQ